MKNRLLILSCSLFVMMCACKKKAETTEQAGLMSGIHEEYFDTSARPQDDFYQYACGGWMNLHPLTNEYARYGSFDQLAEDNLAQLRSLISGLAQQDNKAGTIAYKISILYNMGMDSATCDLQGSEPIRSDLKRIAKIKKLNEIGRECARISTFAADPFLAVMGEADPNNSDRRIAWIWQAGLGIGDRDYYLQKDFQELRVYYVEMITNLLELSGYSRLDNFFGKERQMAEQILRLETQMAQAFMTKEEQRLPENTIHIATVKELDKMLPNMSIPEYLDELRLETDTINIGMPEYFKELNRILGSTDIRTVKAYIAWNLIRSAAPYLSSNFADAHFDFYGKSLSGKKEMQPRWKRVIRTVDGCMGEAVGQMYVKKYFPEKSKERMQHMVANLQEALKERIMQAEWMSDTTKAAAVDKLSAFRVKIGYPDKWRSYDNLKLDGESYWENITKANAFETRYQLSKIGKPVNKDEWLMTPQTVNAYYNPPTNEICFPAGILQPPFFDMDADDAVNYGAIGVVIGHEMTHGFDDQGCKYDKYGNLHNWWTPEDKANFDLRTQVLVDWFNKIEVLPGTFANGVFTLGENIADNGGVNISYQAMQKAIAASEIQENMDGFTAAQRFFIAYAMVWAGNIREEEILHRTKTDPHSLGRWRVNGTLPHITPFVEAFNLKPGDPMYLEPEKRAHIW
ncbi:MAG: M13 family metallopeptidase [Bacteroidales bacterium]|nr:M13 family metallopeptidase [Bacteroidales bacterium]MBP5613945.1 M13 family metallopeptidase [Bacteroidales bacterium]